MQPEPLVFLPAIRHEVLRSDLFGAALTVGLSPILIHRAAEGLAQLALRGGELPGIVRGLRSSQRSLLKRAQALLSASGLPLPHEMDAALSHPAPRGSPGEDDMRGYELRVDGIAAGIAALSRHERQSGTANEAFHKLCKSSSQLEARMRAAYKSALARLKEQLDHRPQIAPSSAIELSDATVTAILRDRFPQFANIEARQVRRLPGINAQEIYFFDVLNHPDWDGPTVLRRPSDYNPTRASMVDEFELLRYLHAHEVPVPAILLAERDPSRLGGIFVMMKRLPGATRTAEQLRIDGKEIALAMAGMLAKIHQVDARALPEPHRDDGQSIVRRMERLIDRFYDRWQAERIEGSLVVESAFSWMRANIGCLQGRVSLVHGDCNFRNILIDGPRVSAMLDWELSHLGHVAEDLAYIRPDVEQLIPWDEFVAAYVAAGGAAASEDALRYFKVWTNLWRTSMAACIYGGYLRGAHRNFIFATVAFNEYYETLDDLCAFMVDET